MTPIVDHDSRRLASATISTHSKSFALAARLLPSGMRDEVRVLYAYCRRVDDAIDLRPPEDRVGALRALREELDEIYAGDCVHDPSAAAFGSVALARGIPRAYPEALLAGMEMDVTDQVYETSDDLLRYCYRVAGTVGLMMCHVMGVRSERALAHAAHLGIAMQLTNIARDVDEDWSRGRLYVPRDLLRACAVPALPHPPTGVLPDAAAAALARATYALLRTADRYYLSADAGLCQLSPRCAFAVRAARLIYAEIGHEVRRRHCDPRAGRAVVHARRKLWLVVHAAFGTFARLPRGLQLERAPRSPTTRVDETQVALGALS